MRLQHPFEIITPTLDGDVLQVLAGAEEWFSTQTINSFIPERSDEGIRKAIKRLVSVGIVEELSEGRAHLFRLNREHLGAQAIVQLAALKQLLYSKISQELSSWVVRPVYAAIFGSAARDDMSHQSDIDLFLIQPDDAPLQTWESRVDALVAQASRWTGSDVRPLLYTETEIRTLGATEPVFQFIAQEGVPVFGERNTFLQMIEGSQ